MGEPVRDAGDSRNVAQQRGIMTGHREHREHREHRRHTENTENTARRSGRTATATRDEMGEVRRDIERTRAELGETVDAIAARVDVRSRLRARVEDVKTMARDRGAQVRDRADRVAERVREATPEPVRGAADQVTERVRRRPGVAIAIGAAVLLALRGLLRRRHR
jgi:hypothetical protein